MKFEILCSKKATKRTTILHPSGQHVPNTTRILAMKSKLLVFFTTVLIAFLHMGLIIDRVIYTCPFDGTEIVSYEIRSRLVCETELDMGLSHAMPWRYVGQCEVCSFPMYQPDEPFTPEEIEQLKVYLASERFQKEARGKSSYFALGVLMELQGESAENIAGVYLKASWQYSGRDPEYMTQLYPNTFRRDYREAARRAMTFYDVVATELAAVKQSQGDKMSEEDVWRYIVALYLPVELSRRMGKFDEASQRAERAIQLLSDFSDHFLLDAMRYQVKLIAAKDASQHDFDEDTVRKWELWLEKQRKKAEERGDIF
ncbi:MAG: DUF2225 domain-containing protein [Proteobacteria bacterium]|nr:DUF2225 domain-containing protein [Pseudomonadota bacterium]